MRTKPNFLSIMTIKQLLPRMLLVVGLAFTGLVSIPNWSSAEPPAVTVPLYDNSGNVVGSVTTTSHGSGGGQTVDRTYTVPAYTRVVENQDAKGNTISGFMTMADGSRTDYHVDASGNKTTTGTLPNGTIETVKTDAAHNVTSRSQQTTYPNGTVATTTFDPKNPYGPPTLLTIKDAKGNITTALPDGKGGFTSAVTEKHGQVATTSYDANGKPTGETTKDKNGKLISTTTVTPDGKGGSTSVTKDKNGKVVSTTTTGPDGKVVSQTGKNKKFSDTGAQSTGGTQTSQGSGKHKDKHKFQTEVFHQAQGKVSDRGLSPGQGKVKLSRLGFVWGFIGLWSESSPWEALIGIRPPGESQ